MTPSKVYRNLNTVNAGSLVKTGPTLVRGWRMSNLGAATQFVKLYDKATTPVVGTDVPKITLPLASGIPEMVFTDAGIGFLFGLGIAATKNIADTDVTAPTANSVVVQVFYL